ncbi:DUF6881 domain-containing protein [Streptomyces sp. NPDC056670]|uniref:DUF6881 domain-containing protein n=1 Tax=Streptomyces sp. NPDC056670 TaxID=3345904 RepID=UPI0036B47EB9
MEYIRIDWLHDFEDDPVTYYSEIDDGRWEVRAVREYRDGRLEWADGLRASGDIGLAELPFPQLEEISIQSDFNAIAIEVSEFERLWNMARSSG